MDDHETQATEQNDGAPTRIVAMLLALAALAERASGRSRAGRCLVLWILRPAEAAARAFALEAFRDLALKPAELLQLEALAEIPFVRNGDSSADAMRLALRFRALAAALSDLPCQEPRFALCREALAGRLLPVLDALRRVQIGEICLAVPAAYAAAFRPGAWNDTS